MTTPTTTNGGVDDNKNYSGYDLVNQKSFFDRIIGTGY